MDIKLILLLLLVVVHGRPPTGVRHRTAKELKKCKESLQELLVQTRSVPKHYDEKSPTLESKKFRKSPITEEDEGTDHSRKLNKKHITESDITVDRMQAMDPNGEDSREPRYTLRLNEANTDNPGPDSHVYVELKAIRREVRGNEDDSDLDGFMLLLLKGEPLSIVLSLDIGSALHRVKSEYITIGPKGYLPNVDIDIYSPEVQSVYRSDLEPLPMFDKVPFAFVVLHIRHESIRAELCLEPENNSYRPLLLQEDERRQRLIRDHLVDSLTIGRNTPYTFCTFFESLKPSSLVDPEKKALLRDWEGNVALPWMTGYTADLSLSRCCKDNRANDQECWVLSTPTPNSANSCESKRPFYLERVINSMVSATDTSVPESYGQCHAGYPGVSAALYGMINDHDYSNAMTAELRKQRECSQRSEATAQTEGPSEEEPMETDDGSDPLLVPRHIFSHENFERCKSHLTKINEIKVPFIMSWLDVIYENRQCKFRCYNCHLYLQKGFRPDIKQPPLFVTSGYLSKTAGPVGRSRNKAQILDHVDVTNSMTYRLHQDATTYVEALKQARSNADVQAAEKAAHDNQKLLFQPTMSAMKLAYAELKAEISFRSHPIFFDTVKDLGVDLGSSHDKDHALRNFAQAFSDGFHRRLLRHLIDSQPPFSFIVDATTSRSTGFLICLLQTIEDGYPVLHMWRLIPLTKSESGANMMADISQWIDADDRIASGFKEFFKSRITTFISDRGSSMIGNRKGLIAHLREYTGHDVLSVACSAHKTETAIKHALEIATGEARTGQKPPKWFSQIGDLNNKIYTYYMSRGSKRFMSLVEVGEELGKSTSRIKYHHSIRWSQSKKAAVETLLKNLDVIREDVTRNSKSRDKDSREKAEAVLKIVNDKHFVSALAELTDILTVSESMLNAFQLQHGLLLGISDTLRSGLRRFEELEDGVGKELKAFLAKTSCTGVCEESSCTLEQFDACDSVQYHFESSDSEEIEPNEDDDGIEEDNSDVSEESLDESVSDTRNAVILEKQDGLNSVPLSEWRRTIYERIVREVKTLFNVEELEAFDALHPKQFLFCSCSEATGQPKCQTLSNCYKMFLPIHSSDVPKDAETKLRRLCTFYKITDCDPVISNFKSLLSAIVVSERYEFLSKDRGPSGFWAYALNDPALPWDSSVRTLLQLVLVTGQSSASAERAFSALTRLRSGDRSNLMPEMLDILIRIALNGPDKIDEDSLYEYTLIFLQKHKRVDQNDRGPVRKLVDDDQKKSTRMFYNSRIYSAT